MSPLPFLAHLKQIPPEDILWGNLPRTTRNESRASRITQTTRHAFDIELALNKHKLLSARIIIFQL